MAIFNFGAKLFVSVILFYYEKFPARDVASTTTGVAGCALLQCTKHGAGSRLVHGCATANIETQNW